MFSTIVHALCYLANTSLTSLHVISILLKSLQHDGKLVRNDDIMTAGWKKIRLDT